MVCPGKDQFRLHTNGTLHRYENQSTLTLVTRETIAGEQAGGNSPRLCIDCAAEARADPNKQCV